MPPYLEYQQIHRRADYYDDRKVNQRRAHPIETSRTQHKLQLQRLSFLTNDKDYIDHPANMKRLTKELDRVNREYRSVRRYQDPLMESLKRLSERQIPCNIPQKATSTDSTSSSISSTGSNTAYSSSPEKSRFLTRWFASNELEQCKDPLSSCHPTITTHINRRSKN
jgi:hypothetical protein